jgi:ubiquitin-protein ligase
MANNIKRILSDQKEIIDAHNKRKNGNNIYNYVEQIWNPSENVWCYFDESNARKMKALIIGTEKTPYEYGYYFFNIEFPEMYPLKPPIVKTMTQDPSGKWRKNPNLYTDGKVCLSMINTWSGPGWVPTNTILTVLVAIQALVMHEKPLTNEPGYEHSSKVTLDAYNNYCYHENYRIGINYMLTNTVYGFELFKPIIEYLFIENYFKIKERLEEFKQKFEGQKISTGYGMCLTCNFNNSIVKSADLYENLKNKYIINISNNNQENTISQNINNNNVINDDILLTQLKKEITIPVIENNIIPSELLKLIKGNDTYYTVPIASSSNNHVQPITEDKVKRKAPNKPAKTYEVGFETTSENDSQNVIYVVSLRKDGVKYWKKKII